MRNVIQEISATSKIIFFEEFLKPYENWRVGLFWNSIIVGFFMLPLGINISTPFFVLSIIIGFFEVYKSKTTYSKRDFAFLLYPMLIILMGFSLFYTEDTKTGVRLLQRVLPLFLFPILLIYIKEDHQIMEKIFKALFLGIFLSFWYNIIVAFSKSIQWIEGNLVFDTSLSGGFSFFDSFNHGGSHFIGQSFSSFIHPSYLALYLLSVLIFFFKKFNKKKQVMLFVFTLLYLFLLSSRASFVVLLGLIVIYIFNDTTVKQKIQKGVVLTFCACIFFIANPRVQTFYYRILNFSEKTNYNYTTSEQSRVLIFYSCIDLIKKAPFLGYGVGDENQVLIDNYKVNKYETLRKKKYNAHNQFFQTALQVGFIGAIILVLPFILVLYHKPNAKGFAMLFILFIFLFFESMLTRYNGVIFYSFMIPFILRRHTSLEDKKPF